MSLAQDAAGILDSWHDSLAVYQNKLPSKGSIGAALVVLERLKKNYDLQINSHVAEGEAQITGLSATSLMRILIAHGETRALSSIGGRSNRGARGDIAK